MAEGERPGKTLLIDAAVHGEEFGGSISLIRFMKELDLSTLRGTIVAVPVMNPLGFWTATRTALLDGCNLNRVFPGSMDNSFSHQLAHVFMEEFCSRADYLIDLHSGGVQADVPLYSIYHPGAGTPAEEVAREMCRHCGSPIIWKIRMVDGLNKSLGANATLRGVPAITIECDGGEVHEKTIQRYLSAIRGVCQYLEFIPGQAPVQEKYLILDEGAFVYNRRGGFFLPDVPVGACVRRGERIGRIMNTLGEIVEELVCQEELACLTALAKPNQPLHAGQLIAEVVPVEGEA